MDSNNQVIYKNNNPSVLPEGLCTPNHQDMRYSRHWFLPPFLVNLALLFSASWLISAISQNAVDYLWFPLPGWTLFATIAVCSPPSLVITRLLPEPSIALSIGGLLTAGGLLWTWLTLGSAQMVALCLLSGTGISLSIQAASVAISPLFIRDSIAASVGTLLLSAIVMLIMCPLETNASEYNHSKFLYLCLAALTSSLVPLMVYLYSRKKLITAQPGKPLHKKPKADTTTALPEKLISLEHENDVTSGSVKDDSKLMISSEGYGVSFMSLIVWLTWGAGVDTTWLSLGWRFQYFSTPTGLASLQLLLCFVLLTMKLCMELSQPCTSSYRINLASNYMQLSLLGTCGLILCLFPEHSRPFHNYLLFTAGLALQYDDLSDLCLVTSKRVPMTVFKHKVVAYQPSGAGQEDSKHSSFVNWCCIVAHIASLFLMSLLAIILGIQLANGLGYLTTLPPLSFICSRGGLMVMSVAAICVSLARPHRWVGQTTYWSCEA